MGRSAQGFFWIWDFFRTRGLDFSSEPTEIRLSMIKEEGSKQKEIEAAADRENTLEEESSGLKGKSSTLDEGPGTLTTVHISLSDGTMRGSVSAIKRKLEEQSIVLSQSGDILSIGLLGEPGPQFLIVNEYDIELADLLFDEESDEDEPLVSWISSLVPIGMSPDTKMKGRRGRCLVVYVLSKTEADATPVYHRWPLVHYHLLDNIQMPHGVKAFHEDKHGFKACLKRNVRMARRKSI
jgi:hypothetical protein